MLLIPCPHCGERDEIEFRYGGEIQFVTATSGDEPLPAEAWGDHLFLRANTAGIVTETWFHLHGCRQVITLKRDTMTDDFITQEAHGG